MTRKASDTRLTPMEPYTKPRLGCTTPMTSRTRATTTSAPLMTITVWGPPAWDGASGGCSLAAAPGATGQAGAGV